MKTVFLAVLLVVLLCASALGLLAALPFVKEGSSWGDMPVFATVAGAALLLGFVWWLAVGRSLPKALIGWAILLLPLVVHGSIVVSLVIGRLEGRRLSRTIQIEAFQEKPIVWAGFDGPIGLELSLVLRHASGISASILPPEIRMGPELDFARDDLSASLTNGSGYLKNTYLKKPVGDMTLLKTVLFQRVFENTAAENPNYKWTSSVRFRSSDTTAVTYFLLPGTVNYLPNRNRVCLDSQSYSIALCSKTQNPDTGCASPNYRRVTDPIYFVGHDLSALWLAAGSYDMIVDLSGQLTAMLRKHSRLQANPDDWSAIQKRLEPEGLAKAGYRSCPPGENSHTQFRVCYCRAS
jgi:hypothetical protein